ncbi:MAG TPA: hypothetical protein VFJ16_12510 [Longimicrobium sp.]|nr:hypothetical protein [Longimicrobium sp.]
MILHRVGAEVRARRRMMRLALCVMLAGVGMARAAAAQEPGPPPPVPVDSMPPFREFGGIFMPDPGRIGFLAGIRAYGPMRRSGYVGLIKAPRRRDRLGYTAELEAGQGGVQLAAGRGVTGTWRMHLNVLRTWGDPMWVEPGQTYMGAELRAGILLGFGLVGYRRVQGSARGDAWAGGLTGVVGI